MRLFGPLIVSLALALGVPATSAGAQVVETPIAFDSTGRVHSITPTLATRYELAPPDWPVIGDFIEARLFSTSAGGSVLAVQRRNGAVERYILTDAQHAALRGLIDAALARTGATVTEGGPETISEPAGGAFVRNQMLLTWGVYGPLLAAATDDGKVGSALYLLATGASYFITTGMSKRANITRSQTMLSTDGAFRGWLTAAGLLYTLAGDRPDSKSFALAGLAGSLAGTTLGYNFGRRLADSEAKAATTISTLSAATALGLSGALGLINDAGVDREAIGIGVAGGVAGYLLGYRYPRTSRYSVTRGDVQLLNLGAVLGLGTALTFVVEAKPSAQGGFAIATAGMLGGTAMVERGWIRRYNHTTFEAAQISLGAVAGSLMGAAVIVLVEPGVTGAMALINSGALLGAIGGHALAAPQRENRAADAGAHGRSSGADRGAGRSAVTFEPVNLGLAAAGVPGNHPLLRVRF